MVEHAAHAGDSLSRWVAVFTAILAALSGLLHYEEGVLQTQALIFKNDTVLLQSKASDQWSYYQAYQAQSSKDHLMELVAELALAERQAFYRDQIAKYGACKKEITAKAQDLEKQVEDANHRSETKEHPQHLFGQALALLSVAISLAAITSLTNNRKLFVLAGAMGAAGVVVSVLAFLHL
ncbi:Trehalose-6-phosphate phosphatase [Candidatus Burkholderia brachyanthoides]|nr:Trehalose-6-phosphate phosphatase [Candidatus Burkholderia brachyanthoides]